MLNQASICPGTGFKLGRSENMVEKEKTLTKKTYPLKVAAKMNKIPKKALMTTNYRGILRANAEDLQRIVDHLQSNRL
jgi:hypothetical protein